MRTRHSRTTYHYRQQSGVDSGSGKNKSWFGVRFLGVMLLLVLAVGVFKIFQPIDAVDPVLASTEQAALAKESIGWLHDSQNAVGDTVHGVLDEKPGAEPRPTASAAKLITALVVLKQKPLQVGEQGPLIAMSEDDMDRYRTYYENEGSTAVIERGQTLSQYELLQGTIIVSSNNYADSLAVWVFGSLENYRRAAQQYVQSIGATKTTIGSDASGYAPDTVSTPHDLVLIGAEAYKHPVLREIMAQKSVTLPLNPLRNNTNWLIGESGIVGGKTGNSDEAGGVYVGIGNIRLANETRTVVVAVQGEKTPYSAIEQSERLLNETYERYKEVTVFQRGDMVATYHTPWGETYQAVAQDDIRMLAWNGRMLSVDVQVDPLSVPKSTKEPVGYIRVGDKSFGLRLTQDATSPTWLWRVFGRI